MKIGLFSSFYPYRGGIAQFSAQLYNALKVDHDVEAFTFKRQYPNFLFPGKSQFVDEADTAEVIDAKRTLDSVNPISYRRTAMSIASYEPDLVISQYWMTFFGPSLGRMHKLLPKGTKRISILHNVIPHEKRFFDNPANRYFLKQNEGFVVMSDSVLKDLLYYRPDAKYLRMDHPVYNQFGEAMNRSEARKKLNLPDDAKVLLFFGFIRDYKGLDLIVEAMEGFDENTHLLVAGEVYGSFDKYQELIDNSPAKGRIHLYTRYIPDDEISCFFSASNVCCLPYKSATQSGITAIAHHFTVPIIATDVGGLKESVEHEKNGLIVNEPKPEQLVEAVNHFFTGNFETQFRADLVRKAEENSWERFAEAIIEFSKTL